MYKTKIEELLNILSEKNDKEGMQLVFILFPAINGTISAYGSYVFACKFGKIRFKNEYDFDSFLDEKKSAFNAAYNSALKTIKLVNRMANENNLPELFALTEDNKISVIKNVMIPFINNLLD